MLSDAVVSTASILLISVRSRPRALPRSHRGGHRAQPHGGAQLDWRSPHVKRRQRCSAQAISDRRRCSSRSQSLIKGFASVTTCYTSPHITNIPQHLLSAIMTREVIYSEQFPLKPHNGWWLATPSSDNPQPPPSRFPASCSSPARLRQARSRLPLWVNSSREDSLITYADHGFEQSQGRSRALGL